MVVVLLGTRCLEGIQANLRRWLKAVRHLYQLQGCGTLKCTLGANSIYHIQAHHRAISINRWCVKALICCYVLILTKKQNVIYSLHKHHPSYVLNLASPATTFSSTLDFLPFPFLPALILLIDHNRTLLPLVTVHSNHTSIPGSDMVASEGVCGRSGELASGNATFEENVHFGEGFAHCFGEAGEASVSELGVGVDIGGKKGKRRGREAKEEQGSG